VRLAKCNSIKLRHIVLIGMMLMVAGGLLAATENYQMVLAGRLTSGVGAVLLNGARRSTSQNCSARTTRKLWCA
jgi:predicted MFS family arabinose efflux permease